MKSGSRYAAVVLLCLLGIALSLVFIRNLIDFPVYYSAGRTLLSGRVDLYAPDFALGQVMDYRYLPLFLVALVPLWHLPYNFAAFVWYLANYLCVLVIARSMYRMFTSEPGRTPATAETGGSNTGLRFATLDRRTRFLPALICGLAVAQYFVMALHYGNAHLIAITLVFISYQLLQKNRDLNAALAMGAAILIKLTPVMLLPYFAIKRRWKYLGLTAVVIGCGALLPSLYFGASTNFGLLRQWFDHVIVNQSFHEMNGPINLALKGQALRYLTNVDYESRVGGDSQYPSVDIVALAPTAVEKVAIGASILIFVAAILWIWRRTAQGDTRGRYDKLKQTDGSPILDDLEFGVLICIMLLVGPLTSKIYFVALVWPVVAVARSIFATPGRTPASAKALLILVGIANAVLPLIPGRAAQRLLLVLGVDFYINCAVMLAALILVLARGNTAVPSSSAPETALEAS